MLTNIVFLIIIFSLIVTVSLILKHQILSPWSITPFIWAVILFLYICVKDELYAVPTQFVTGITIWVLTFSGASFIAYSFFPKYKKRPWAVCDKNVDIITLMTLILVPFAVYKAIQHAVMMASPEGLFYTLREQAVNPEENQLGIVKYFIYVINVLLIIELNRDKIRKRRLSLIVILCILFFIATMAKLTLLMYIFSGLYILYNKKRISLKPIALFIFFIISLVPIMQLLRQGGDNNTDGEMIGNILLIYTISSIIAFGTITPYSSMQWGETTFRPFYNILHSLGFNVMPTEALQDFELVPMPTNVYTVMFPYYKDFGFEGIFIFALLEGIAIGAIYKYSKSGCNIMTYLYAYIFTLLIMQFFDELIMQGISAILQTIIIIIICHTNISLRKKTLNV